MAGKLSNFFLTDVGQKIVTCAAYGFSSAALLAGLLPHTLNLSTYENFVRLYNKGMTVPLSNELVDRFWKTIDALDVDQNIKHLYKPFHVYGFDMFSAGSAYSKFGSIIGIPAHFSYKSVDDINKSQIKLRHDSILWDTDEGKQLASSLILSEKAQMYAIAREIKYRATMKPLFDGAAAGVIISLTYAIGKQLNHTYNLNARPYTIRAVIYSLLSVMSCTYYFFLKDVYQVNVEDEIDEELVQNPVFAEGGMEFYGKILQRNIALRKLLGREGENMYTALGNENSFFRTKHSPLVQRLTYFKESFSGKEKQ